MVGFFVLVSVVQKRSALNMGSTGEKIKNFEKIRVKTCLVILKLSEW